MLLRRRKTLTLAEKTDIQDRRMRLQSRIDSFNHNSQVFLANGDWDNLVLERGGWGYAKAAVKDSYEVGEGGGEEEEDEDENEDENDEWPEHAVLYMPSALGKKQCAKQGWASMVNQEMELRVGQADESLEKLRLALGHKSLLLRNSVRKATGQKGKTRAWNDVNKVEESIRREVAIYHRARAALMGLEAGEDILNRYKPIKTEDLKMSGDIVEENRIGQRNDALAWFWRLDGAGQNPDDDWMQECKCFKNTEINYSNGEI